MQRRTLCRRELGPVTWSTSGVFPFRHGRGLVIALQLGVCAALLAASADGAGTSMPPHGGTSMSPCHAQVREAVLPSWARSGFHPPTQPMPHELGRSGRIVAIIFGYPLLSPPPRDHSNKILWVARRANGTALWIRAQRMAGLDRVGAPVGRVIAGGPGPSIVNLPAPGCWRLTLGWAGQVDTLDLRYRANRRS